MMASKLRMRWAKSRRKLRYMMPLWVVLGSTVGCDRAPDSLSTDWIQVPGTASGKQQDVSDAPQITFVDSVWSFEPVPEGTVLRHTFTFQNTGNAPLLLTDVHGECGCTVVRDWPREPIPPGGEDSLTVAFDTRGKQGDNRKQISVAANTFPAITLLTLKGRVVGPATPSPAPSPEPE